MPAESDRRNAIRNVDLEYQATAQSRAARRFELRTSGLSAMNRRNLRRGNVVQYCVIGALIAISALVGVSMLGSRTQTGMTTISSDVANPANLKNHFKAKKK
jgi:hypothetical protein